jgi:murein DD-endopeptidase MepM/ murein hydrolase activator NlpD
LRQGSIVVKPGDKVRAGQRIGAIGNSGASGGVHVHVERRTGDGLAGIATLPAFFRDVRLANGGTSAPTRGLVLDTGDIVDAR